MTLFHVSVEYYLIKIAKFNKQVLFVYIGSNSE